MRPWPFVWGSEYRGSVSGLLARAALALLVPALALAPALWLFAPQAAASAASPAPATVDASPHSAVQVPTVSEAVALALRNSAQAAIARAQLEAAVAGSVNMETALLGWRFDGVLDDTLNQSEQLASIPALAGDPLNTLSATLAVRKALGVAGTTALALEESRLQRARAEREYVGALRELAVSAYEAYRQLELALIQYRLLERAVDLSRDSLEAAREQEALGAQSPVQVGEARLAYQEALQRRDAARRLLDIAWQRLARLLGMDASDVDILDVDVIGIDDALAMIDSGHPAFWPEQPLPWTWTLDELVALARENRPEVQSARDGVALATLGLDKVKLDQRPDVQLTASATWPDQVRASITLDDEWVAQGTLSHWRFSPSIPNAPSQLTQAPAKDVDWSVGLRVTVNLWDGGASKAAVYRAEQTVRQAELGLDEALHGVALDVERRFAELQSAYEALLLATERAGIARLNAGMESAKEALGMSSRLHVDAATVNLWQAVTGAISARFDYEIAVLKLAAAAAFDLETLGRIIQDIEGW